MKNIFTPFTAAAVFFVSLSLGQAADHPTPLAPGVRGVATRAPANMKMDGDLSYFKDAFCTPVEYFNADLKNRAGQFFFMWDDEAFYAGLRTLDTKPANNSDDDHLWEGDAVEWYFDTRQDENFRSHDWGGPGGAGAVHCYWTGLKGTEVQPRFCLRPGYLDAIKKIGVEVAAKRTKVGMDVEFKLPWANFPNFKPGLNAIIALDAELCYSDGGGRVFRSFVFGSPLSVQQPANLSKIQLVDKLVPAYWPACGPVMAPIHCDTPWGQKTKPHVTGHMALPPNQTDQIGKVVFRILGLDGKKLGDFPGTIETFATDGNFQRATAQWPTDLALPGAHELLGIIYDKSGKELTRVAPRLVSVNMNPGY
ncbi:MAG TPA: sugar-binding protein [Verrucomicrobiae bacterium]|nr:sugar-binding protein [Verrucomicrobiae bacterium]